MTPFLHRLTALGLKFVCPILILHLADQSELGKYYLATTFLTVVAMLIALEMAIPFSAAYLRANTARGRRRVFTNLLISEFFIATVLSLPPLLICVITANQPISVLALLPAVFVVETCSCEIGRFFWNIGASDIASRRDLFRAIAISVAVITSVVINRSVVTPLSLLLLSLLNLLLIVWELSTWGEGAGIFQRLRAFGRYQRRRLAREIASSLRISIPQVIHGRILSIQPLLERYLIERQVGLALVGAYSFHYSLIQTGASLVLMPHIARIRRTILSDKASPSPQTYRSMLRFLAIVAGVIVVFTLCAKLAIPVLSVVLNKSVQSDIFIALVAGIAGGVSTFCAAISPLYALRGRLWKANVATLFSMAPIVAYIFLPNQAATSVYYAIVISAILQLLQRLLIGLKHARSG